jgi:TRAP-type C4-dicarboxylate transport system permease small subunit
MNTSLRRLSAGWAIAGGVLIILIMIVTTANAGAFAIDRVLRNFGGTMQGLPGYEDFVRLTVSCAALMFFPYCQFRRGHVSVDLFVSPLPSAARAALDRMWLAMMTLIALFLGYWMIVGMIETMNDNVLSPILGWQQWPFFIPGIISLFLWALVAAAQIFERTSDV